MRTLNDILNEIPRLPKHIQTAVIDLFCGAGGYSWGVKKARIDGKKVCKVVICVNHDAKAIASHYANMPDALHLVEDIRTVSMKPFIQVVDTIRKHHPHIKIVLHASLECTNHSKAKGGMSRDADSRTLADHLFRYIEAIRPDYISIENVEEFLIWGPLKVKEVKCKTGDHCPIEVKTRKPTRKDPKRVVSVNPVWVPIPEQKATFYNAWIEKVKAHGFEYQYRILNSADYGAYTSRKRYFGLFALPHLPIVFPQPTHAKNPQPNLFEEKKRWKPVRDVLSLDIQGESIFTKDPQPVEATLERVLAGCIKFVAGGKKEFMVKYNSMSQRRTYVAPGVDDPCPVVSTQGRLGVAQVDFIKRYNSGSPMDKCTSTDEPCGVVTTANRFAFVQAQFLSKYFSGNPDSKNSSVEEPAGAVTCIDHHALVSADFLSSYYGNGGNRSINEPSPTVTTKDRFARISPRFLANSYSGGGQLGSVDEPTGAILTNPKQNLVTCEPWVMNTNFGNIGSSVGEPAPTITSDRHWHYLLNPQYTSEGGSVDAPCFTLIARMDKAPPYLMKAETSGEIAPFIKRVGNVLVYEVYDTDSEVLVKIKEFMAMYVLVDIKMRMLLIDELKRIMGLPTDYVLKGTQADQKKFIGNAVETNQAEANMTAIVIALLTMGIVKTA